MSEKQSETLSTIGSRQGNSSIAFILKVAPFFVVMSASFWLHSYVQQIRLSEGVCSVYYSQTERSGRNKKKKWRPTLIELYTNVFLSQSQHAQCTYLNGFGQSDGALMKTVTSSTLVFVYSEYSKYIFIVIISNIITCCSSCHTSYFR